MDVFTALADPTRRNILRLLSRKGTMPASEIYGHYPATPPAISQHLKILRQTHLVTVKRRQQQRLYSVRVRTLNEVGRWVNEINDIWDKRLKRLEQLVSDSS